MLIAGMASKSKQKISTITDRIHTSVVSILNETIGQIHNVTTTYPIESKQLRKQASQRRYDRVIGVTIMLARVERK